MRAGVKFQPGIIVLFSRVVRPSLCVHNKRTGWQTRWRKAVATTQEQIISTVRISDPKAVSGVRQRRRRFRASRNR